MLPVWLNSAIGTCHIAIDSGGMRLHSDMLSMMTIMLVKTNILNDLYEFTREIDKRIFDPRDLECLIALCFYWSIASVSMSDIGMIKGRIKELYQLSKVN
jgi:hypothetical protein